MFVVVNHAIIINSYDLLNKISNIWEWYFEIFLEATHQWDQ